MMRLTTSALALAFSMFAACGVKDDVFRPAGTPSIQQSSVALNSPPDVVSTSGLVADDDFMFLTDGSACVRVSKGDLSSTSQEVNVTGSKVLWADKWEVDSVAYLVVSVVDASDIASLYRYHDSDSDGLPDESTETLLFHSGTAKMYITDGVWGGEDGHLYFLDRRCQDIQVAEDTDDDGWPDTICSTAFALSSAHPELLGVRSIAPEMTGLVGEIYGPNAGGAQLVGGARFVMYDADDDLVAEAFFYEPGQMLAPSTWGVPYSGQTSIDVDGGTGSNGSTAEIWEVDANYDDVASLGSVVLGSDGKGTITLSRALVEDEVLSVRFDGKEDDHHLPVVMGDQPQLLELVYDNPLPLAAATTITMKGLNLTLGMTVRVRDVAKDTESDLAVATLVSSTEATVTIPTSVATSTSTRGWQVWLLPSASSEDTSYLKLLPADSSTVYSITSFVPSSGAVGTEVVLTGSGFEERDVEGVCFDGVPATTFTVDSDTQITATVPAGTQTGRITVIQLHNMIMSAIDFTVTVP